MYNSNITPILKMKEFLVNQIYYSSFKFNVCTRRNNFKELFFNTVLRTKQVHNLKKKQYG